LAGIVDAGNGSTNEAIMYFSTAPALLAIYISFAALHVVLSALRNGAAKLESPCSLHWSALSCYILDILVKDICQIEHYRCSHYY
jgi:flagellar biosynthesis protein FliP